MRKEKAMQHVLLLLIGVMLTVSVGGCAPGLTSDQITKNIERHYDETLRVEEIDAGVYMIAASMDGEQASNGREGTMKESVLRKAREHCAQENKAIKVVSQEAETGEYSKSISQAGFLAGSSGWSVHQKAAKFDIVFQCRERTTPAETPAPTPEAP